MIVLSKCNFLDDLVCHLLLVFVIEFHKSSVSVFLIVELVYQILLFFLNHLLSVTNNYCQIDGITEKLFRFTELAVSLFILNKVFSLNLFLKFEVNHSCPLWFDFLPIEWTLPLILKHNFNTLNTEKMSTWKSAWLNHDIHTNRTVFVLLFIFAIYLLIFGLNIIWFDI